MRSTGPHQPSLHTGEHDCKCVAGASNHVLPNHTDRPPRLSRSLSTGLRSSPLQTKSHDSKHPRSPHVPSLPVPSPFPPRNTYSAPSISVPAHQQGHTMCASTASSYRISGPMSGTSDSSMTLRTVSPMESRGSHM